MLCWKLLWIKNKETIQETLCIGMVQKSDFIEERLVKKSLYDHVKMSKLHY